MGYTTEFKGDLKFTEELTASQISFLDSILGEDCRDHPEWGRRDLTYIDLEFNESYTALRWNSAEKTSDLTEKVSLVVSLLKEKWPSLGLVGELLAQGEDVDDRWRLTIDESGIAQNEVIPVSGNSVKCPDCGHRFRP